MKTSKHLLAIALLTVTAPAFADDGDTMLLPTGQAQICHLGGNVPYTIGSYTYRATPASGCIITKTIYQRGDKITLIGADGQTAYRFKVSKKSGQLEEDNKTSTYQPTSSQDSDATARQAAAQQAAAQQAAAALQAQQAAAAQRAAEQLAESVKYTARSGGVCVAQKVLHVYAQAENYRLNLRAGLLAGLGVTTQSFNNTPGISTATRAYQTGLAIGQTDGVRRGSADGQAAGRNAGAQAAYDQVEQIVSNAMNKGIDPLKTSISTPAVNPPLMQPNFSNPKSIGDRLRDVDSSLYTQPVVFSDGSLALGLDHMAKFWQKRANSEGTIYSDNFTSAVAASAYTTALNGPNKMFNKWIKREMVGCLDGSVTWSQIQASAELQQLMISEFTARYLNVLNQPVSVQDQYGFMSQTTSLNAAILSRTQWSALAFQVGQNSGAAIMSSMNQDQGEVDAARQTYPGAAADGYRAGFQSAFTAKAQERAQYHELNTVVSNVQAHLIGSSLGSSTTFLIGDSVGVVIDNADNRGENTNAEIDISGAGMSAVRTATLAGLSSLSKPITVANVAQIPASLELGQPYPIAVTVGGTQANSMSIQIDWSSEIAGFANLQKSAANYQVNRAFIISKIQGEFAAVLARGVFSERTIYQLDKNGPSATLLGRMVATANGLSAAQKANLEDLKADLLSASGPAPTGTWLGGNPRKKAWAQGRDMINQL